MINGEVEAVISYKVKFDDASAQRVGEMIDDLVDVCAVINGPAYKEMRATLYEAQKVLVNLLHYGRREKYEG